MQARHRDALLGAAVLAVLLGLGLLASRLDSRLTARPITLAAVQRAWPVDPPLSSSLPLLDLPCEGSRVRGSAVAPPGFAGGTFVLCALESGGVIGLRIDLPAQTPAAVELPLPGVSLVGGPIDQERGFLLYFDSGSLRWTNSRRRARSVSRGLLLGDSSTPQPPRLVFGHAGWGREQLDREIEAGYWEMLE